MTYPLVGGGDLGGPRGYTYGAVLVRTADRTAARPGLPGELLATLREIRFSGWLARADGDWTVAVAAHGDGVVATGGRGLVDVGERLAERFAPATVVAVRVVADRQLLLAVWSDGEEVGRYVSDPSYGLGPGDDTLPDPLGVEHAEAFADACGVPESADDLAELLAEELDPESVIESERLAGVLRLLGLPSWLVAASSLPRDVPAGPRESDLTRLGAGAEGIGGRLRGWAADVVRRRRRPPSAIPEAPRGGPQHDPWLF
jgi:hypothetical protein